MKNIKVELSIIGPILILSIIPIGLYSTFLPTAVLSQSEDNTSDNVEDSDTLVNSVSYSGNSKFVILTFDDGYKTQYTTAKPILDKYGYKATFYIVCNYAQKIDADRMNWNDIQELQKQGHDIGSHTMNHHDLTQIPPYRIDYEIGISKECLLANGIKNVTSFAYPFAEGSTNATIINTVAKHYPIARTADAPLMFLECRGWDNDNEDGSDDISSTLNSSTTQSDCREYSEDGRLNLVNRYTIRGWAHDSERAENLFSDEYMLHRFKEVVDAQTKYNEDSNIRAIPIIIWHNIANNVKDDPYTTTSIDLFEAEIKYLHDNGFNVITMSDLMYDENTQILAIEENKSLPKTSIVDYSENDVNNGEP
jgi:peptidoglycan/xylan/chitin deacetylase (PgdA/CDA1 family)